MPTEVAQETRRNGKRHARIDDANLAMKADFMFAYWAVAGTFGLIIGFSDRERGVFTCGLQDRGVAVRLKSKL